LGIGDDIRPKKYQRIIDYPPEVKIVAAEKKNRDEISKKLFSKQNGGDFFADTPIEKNGELKAKKNSHQDVIKKTSHHWIYTLTASIVILVLIGVVIWQNLDTIKGYFNGSYKKQNDQNLNDIISSTNNSLNNYNSSEQNQTSQQNSGQQSAATTPAIDKSRIVISVLNGCGVKNAARNAADILTTAGFNVANTSNAKSFSYASSIIYYKSGKEAEANLVKEALADRVSETEKSDTIVGIKYDIVVVVGKK